jgi:photosystem II stability/assembly factor-like uncharacterized protein
MRELNCHSARLWLQAPHELVAAEMDHLQMHLAACPTCEAYRRDAVNVDDTIRHSLSLRVGDLSVRDEVRQRIANQTPGPRGHHTVRRRRLAFRPRLLWAPVALALAIVLVAFLIPQTTGDRGGGSHAMAATWHPIRKDINFPLAIDPTRPDHLLVGALGRVYESWDAGIRWRPLPSIGASPIITDLAIDSSDPKHYLVATKHSILASHDAGHHWITVASSMPGAYNMFLLQDPRSPSTFYVGPSTLWKSTDGGTTWHPTGDGKIFSPNGIQTLTVGTGGRLYTGVWSNGVGISTDGGTTWMRRSRGLAPNVMTISVRPGRLLAATDSGIYRSTNDGVSWRLSGPGLPFFTTSVYDAGTFQLAGGNGGVFRSTDGGKHWSVAVAGLPLYSYVYGFIADPQHPNRVYASLDSDGNFRSDDGGLHWQPINNGLPIAGLPLTGYKTEPPLVLFARKGVLWHTDDQGTDPGTLSVDSSVREAQVSPDFAAVAYIASAGNAWSLAVVGAGGSAANRLVTGIGTLPQRLAWSPDALHVAVAGANQLDVADLNGHAVHWTAAPAERFLAWSRDGSGILFWSRRNHRVIERAWRTGEVMSLYPGRYPRPPLVGPNGTTIAVLNHRWVKIGSWTRTSTRVARLPAHCTLRSWADTGTAVLAICPGKAVVVSVEGHETIAPHLTVNTEWVPESSSDLLFFRGNSLWHWSPGSGARAIVNHAGPISNRLPLP